MTRYLELADYLLIAETVLGVPAELIADFNRTGLAVRERDRLSDGVAVPELAPVPRALGARWWHSPWISG